MEDQIHKLVQKTAVASGLEVSKYKNIWSFDPGVFDKATVICVEGVAKEMEYSYDKLCSHTGESSIVEQRGDIDRNRPWFHTHQNGMPNSYDFHPEMVFNIP